MEYFTFCSCFSAGLAWLCGIHLIFVPFFDEFKELRDEIQNDPNFWSDYSASKALNNDKFRNHYKPKVSKYFMKRGNIERMSLNYPIQGSSADITKLAGVYFFRYLIENDLLFKVKMANVVHDEWIVECGESISKAISISLQDCMERAGDVFCKTVKLKAEPEITQYWQH